MCTAKEFSYAYTCICSFSSAFPTSVITECWAALPVLGSRSLLSLCTPSWEPPFLAAAFPILRLLPGPSWPHIMLLRRPFWPASFPLILHSLWTFLLWMTGGPHTPFIQPSPSGGNGLLTSHTCLPLHVSLPPPALACCPSPLSPSPLASQWSSRLPWCSRENAAPALQVLRQQNHGAVDPGPLTNDRLDSQLRTCPSKPGLWCLSFLRAQLVFLMFSLLTALFCWGGRF